MLGFELSQHMQAYISLAILAMMLILFLRETFPIEVVAVGAGAIMILLGIVRFDDMNAVLSNNAPWTIAAMFIIVSALVRTGALEGVSQLAIRNSARHPRMTLIALGCFVTVTSAFVNNTPLVVVMMPIFVQLARQLKIAPSKLLIPLSYMTILGGTITMIGTSTNLVVDGVAQKAGLAHFNIFEITPIGLLVAAAGLVYLAVVGPRFLPSRDSMSALLADKSKMKFFTEVAIPEELQLIGKAVNDIDDFRRGGVRVVDVLRGDELLRRDLAAARLQAGDRLVLRSPMSEILGLQGHKDLRLVDKLSSVETETVEVLITPGCLMVGRSLGSMRLRRRYGVYPLAVHRRNQNIGRQLDDLVVQVGDTLLLEGAPRDIGRLADDMEMVDVAKPSDRAYRRSHAPIVLAVMAAVVLLSAFNVAPILILALLGVAVVLVTGCIDSDEAFASIDGQLMALLFGMLTVGAGLENSGAVQMIVNGVGPMMAGMSPFMLVFCTYALTSFLTEIVSNNAVGVVVTPVVIALATQLGVDPRPLVITVMIGASASFATPVGYQTNTLVYGPGGYKFADFIWFGVPLNVLSLIVVTIFVPLIYPF